MTPADVEQFALVMARHGLTRLTVGGTTLERPFQWPVPVHEAPDSAGAQEAPAEPEAMSLEDFQRKPPDEQDAILARMRA